jgi:hypothetical protein
MKHTKIVRPSCTIVATNKDGLDRIKNSVKFVQEVKNQKKFLASKIYGFDPKYLIFKKQRAKNNE